MSDFVFTKETILKANLYTRLKEILVEAGWRNISSRPSTDFDVFYSEGESGNRGLYFSMKEYNTNVSQSFSNSNSGLIYCRLVKGYVPNQTIGTAGTFERNEGFKGCYITSNMSHLAPLTIYYHCNRNRLILFAEPPHALISSSNPATYFTIGVPDVTFGRAIPKYDLIFACSYFEGQMNNSVFVTDQPDSPRSSSYALATIDAFSSFPSEGKSVSINNILFFGEVAYGNASEGLRGKLDGVYIVKEPSTHNSYFWLSQFKHGDEFIDGDGKRYKIFMSYGNPSYYSSLSSKFFAFRIG